MLSAIDLFAGAGGLSVGLKAAGFSVLGSVELDPTSAETYRMNHPKTNDARIATKKKHPAGGLP